MSANGDSGPGRREVAYRLFAAEFDDASLSYSESDEERAPNYVVTPTGLRVNRLFAVGVLTEIESINEDTLRGRIVDPTGAFVTYAGQYQPPAQAFLEGTTPPAFVAITGKARTFEPEDSDRVFTSVRPESLSEVDANTRDRWVVSAAESTLHRIAVCAAALDSSLRGDELQSALSEAGVDDSLAVGIPRALDHYGTTTAYLDALRQLAIDALEVVVDERDEVRSLSVGPGEGSETALGELPKVDIEIPSEPVSPTESTETESEATATELAAEPVTEDQSEEPTQPASAETPDSSASTAEPDSAETETDSTMATDTETDAESTADPDASTGQATESVNESQPTTDPADKSEPTAEPAAETANGAADSVDTDTTAASEDDIADEATEESGMYQLDDEEREELESEFDTGFSSGNDVDPAGEADIDVPDVDELAEQAEAEDGAETEETLGEFDDGLGDFEDDTTAAEPANEETATDELASEESDTTVDESAESAATDPADATSDGDGAADDPTETVDLEEAVVEMMRDLDDGDGVDRAQLVTDLVETHGVDDDAVEDAIDDALMGGRCYEPEDGTLKAI